MVAGGRYSNSHQALVGSWLRELIGGRTSRMRIGPETTPIALYRAMSPPTLRPTQPARMATARTTAPARYPATDVATSSDRARLPSTGIHSGVCERGIVMKGV